MSDDELLAAAERVDPEHALPDDASAQQFADSLRARHGLHLITLDRVRDDAPWVATFAGPRGRGSAHDPHLWRAVYVAGLRALEANR